MKTLSRSLIAMSLAALLAAGAQAAERHTSVTGPNGKTATRDTVRSGGDVSSTTTGPNGKTSSRVVDRSASGATATVTGPNGKVVNRTSTRQP